MMFGLCATSIRYLLIHWLSDLCIMLTIYSCSILLLLLIFESKCYVVYRCLLVYCVLCMFLMLLYAKWTMMMISITWNVHCACAVSRDVVVTWLLRVVGNDPHFWNPLPQFIYSLCHFQGATTKSKPFIPLSRLQSSLCITFGDPPKPHVTIFFIPNCLFTILLFMGLRWRLR